MQSTKSGYRKTNQVYVSTGLQIINAIEYIHISGKEKDNNVLVICTIKPELIKEIHSVLNLYNWSEVRFLFPDRVLKIRNYYLKVIFMTVWSWTKLQIIFDKKADYILGFDHNLYCKYVAKKAGNKRITLLDDGVGSLAFKTNDNHYHTYSRVNKLRHIFFGVTDFVVKFDTFFTSYKKEIESKGYGHLNLVKNEYTYLKSLVHNKATNNNVYFIGDPLVERNAITEEAYFKQIADIKAIFGDNLFYVPRVSENPEKLKKISSIVNILQPDVPFEIFLIKSENLPKKLIGYHTSVLFNSYNLFGDAIELHHIKLKEITREVYKTILPDVYKALDLISTEWPETEAIKK